MSPVPVCPLESITPDRGVRALVDGRAVAVFRLSGSGELCALDDVDPFSGASVLSRGLVGVSVLDGSTVPYVASPLRKQRFALRDGRCLDDPGVGVAVHRVEVRDGVVVVSAEGCVHHGGGTVPKQS